MALTSKQLMLEALAQLEQVNMTEAHDLLENRQVTLLDVREKVEFDAGHIDGAEHISRGLLEFMIEVHPKFSDRTLPVLVYCKTGGRSALAGATLRQMGFNRVLNLEGGFDAWTQGQNIPEGMLD
ncbi:MAG: rhodanese-like domain-containing protein [Pseudomonadales bacterium]|nr:rhodanese-like domain-containing protein [Pseudomonadales bacterium]